ncbi:MAG: fatty acid desaturase [bacterium]
MAVIFHHIFFARYDSFIFPSANHELCHRTVFKTQWLNDGFLVVFCLLGWLNYRVYRFSHNYHHRYTLLLEGDREEILPNIPSLRFLYIVQLFSVNISGGYQSRGIIPTLSNLIKLANNDTSNPFNSWGSELYEGHSKQRAKAVNWARTVLAFHTGVAVFAVTLGYPILFVIISVSPFIAHWNRYFVGVTMHCGLQSNVADFRKCARSVVLDPISEFLYWHMNWRLEHHMYAAVPCYNLNKLHHILATDMPTPRTLLGAWKEMRETWQRQKLIWTMHLILLCLSQRMTRQCLVPIC